MSRDERNSSRSSSSTPERDADKQHTEDLPPQKTSPKQDDAVKGGAGPIDGRPNV